MALKFKEMITGATLTGSAVALYTSPALTAASVQAATCYNPTASVVILQVFKVPVSGSATSATLICSRNVPSGVSVMVNELINHKLEAGTSIFALGAALTLNVSGVEYVPD